MDLGGWRVDANRVKLSASRADIRCCVRALGGGAVSLPGGIHAVPHVIAALPLILLHV